MFLFSDLFSAQAAAVILISVIKKTFSIINIAAFGELIVISCGVTEVISDPSKFEENPKRTSANLNHCKLLNTLHALVMIIVDGF